MVERIGIAAVALAIATGPAAASPAVAIDLDPCIADPDAVRAAVELELGPADTGPPAAQVFVRCNGDLRLLSVQDSLTDKRLERAISLADLPTDAHARVIGLAVAELVAASWLELAAHDPPAPPPAAIAAAAAPTPPTPTPAPWALGVAAVPRILAAVDTRGLAIDLAHSRGALRIAADLTAERGVVATGFGDVTATSGSLALRAGAGARRLGLALDATAGVRAGVVRLAGDPTTQLSTPIAGDSITGAWLAPIVRLDAHARAGAGRIGLAIGVEAGWVMTPVRGAIPGGGEIGWSGPFVAPRLAIEVHW